MIHFFSLRVHIAPSVRTAILLSGVLTMSCPILFWTFFLFHTLHYKRDFDFDYIGSVFVTPRRITLTEITEVESDA